MWRHGLSPSSVRETDVVLMDHAGALRHSVALKMENGDYSSGISVTRALDHDGYNTTPHIVQQ
jgi:hypothetical protein